MALDQQMSLRLSEAQRREIRSMMERLKSESSTPDKVTEADALRAIVDGWACGGTVGRPAGQVAG